jgi:hypothetical protein
MHLLSAVIIVLLFLAPGHAADTLTTALWLWRGATLQSLATPAALAPLNVRLTEQFEVVRSDQIVALTSTGDLVDLTACRRLPAKTPLALTAFTADQQVVIGVRGRRLGWYNGETVVEKIQLPQEGLTVVAGAKKRLYLYGTQGSGSVVYLLEQGRAGKLFEVPDGRISTLTVIGERLFFAVGNSIYTAAEGQRPAVVFVAATAADIRSIAADPRTGLLYFAVGDTVYAMRAGMAISLLRGLEGTLRYAGGALYVLDPWKDSLVTLRGLETLLEVGAGSEQTGADAPPAQFKD